MRRRKLIPPNYLSDGDPAWISLNMTGSTILWRRGMVLCAAGDHARVGVRVNGEFIERWRHVEALRIEQTDPLDVVYPDSYEPAGPAFVGNAP